MQFDAEADESRADRVVDGSAGVGLVLHVGVAIAARSGDRVAVWRDGAGVCRDADFAQLGRRHRLEHRKVTAVPFGRFPLAGIRIEPANGALPA